LLFVGTRLKLRQIVAASVQSAVFGLSGVRVTRNGPKKSKASICGSRSYNSGVSSRLSLATRLNEACDAEIAALGTQKEWNDVSDSAIKMTINVTKKIRPGA
jgi:hypothetical protein